MSIYDDCAAECLIHFLDDCECYDDFCDKQIFEDLSIAEYIAKY